MTTTTPDTKTTPAGSLTAEEFELLEGLLLNFHTALDNHLYAIFTERHTRELFADIEKGEALLARIRSASANG